MPDSSPPKTELTLRITFARDGQDAPTTETELNDFRQFLLRRLVVLDSALRRLDELRGEAAEIHRRVRHRVIDKIIQDVPDGIAACEFDCRKRQCTLGEWAACEQCPQQHP
jgi:hypothetical protein